MKNIHVLPTDKPSRLHAWVNNKGLRATLYQQSQFHLDTSKNIFITNNEKPKAGDYAITEDNEIIQLNQSTCVFYDSKIILTTDQDLIKNGVQAIDDEFLELFVKNPSCDFVKTKLVEFEVDMGLGESCIEYGNYYKILIPKEEPKQELSVRLQNSLKQFNLTLEEAINTEPHRLKQIGFSNRSIIELQSLKPKQETLEEVAERIYPIIPNSHPNINWDIINKRDGFTEGYKLAQQQNKNLYSDEDMTKYALYILNNTVITPKEWFEQFKKK